MSIRARANCIGTDRMGNVLEGLLAKVGELNLDLTAYVIVGGRRDADATRFRDALKPRSDVDTVPENVIALDQDVPEIDPDPEQHSAVGGHPFVTFGHHCLHRHGAFDCIDHRRKFKQHAVARCLHETSAVFCHESFSCCEVFAEGAGSADLVEAHEPRVPGNVSGHDCRQPASDPAWMRFAHGTRSPSRDIMYDGSVSRHRGTTGSPAKSAGHAS